MHGSTLKSLYSEPAPNEIDTAGEIDTVIFSDGEIAGPDTSHYEQAVQRRHGVFISMESELRDLSSADEARTGAQQIILQTRTSSDPADRERHQIARAAASSGDPKAFIAEFRKHTIPAKFYRLQMK